MGIVFSVTSPAFAHRTIQQDLAGVLKALSEQITGADQRGSPRGTARKRPVEAQL
jgi:hypothetical protein